VPVAANTNSLTNLVFFVNLFNNTNAPIGIAQTVGVIINPNTPPFINLVQLSGGQVTLNWLAIPSKSYTVQYKTNLTDATWNNLSGNVSATNFIASKTDTSGLATRRFYRIMVLP